MTSPATAFFMGQKCFKVQHVWLKYVVTRLHIRTGRVRVRMRLAEDPWTLLGLDIIHGLDNNPM